ncbi:hypothetical protein M9Y10_010273 [Tritrichomonas musculus]|uniref:Uncharacterized protein n=1 Tax=Tritrichomonas musculus TaxID=1915356 RepID=A0ABR2IKF6_9EUKA
MTRISFRVNSIELKDYALQKINEDNLMKLSLSKNNNQKPDEYLLKSAKYLYNIKHEFIIEDPSNKVQKLTLTLSTAMKKVTLANLFSFDNNETKMTKNKNFSVDHYIQGCKESHEGCIDCEYYESLNSLIGYRNIEIKELKKGISNIFHMELITRGNVKVVGYVNLEIYIWDCLTKNNLAKKSTPVYNEPILFVDPGCQVNTEHINY